MDCEEIKDLSSDYIDNSSNSLSSMAISEHIKQCSKCSQFIQDMEQLKSWSKSLSNTSIPEDVSTRLRDNLREKLGL